MQSWRDGEADRAVTMLHTCACLAEDALADHFGTLLPAMCKVSLCCIVLHLAAIGADVTAQLVCSQEMTHETFMRVPT